LYDDGTSDRSAQHVSFQVGDLVLLHAAAHDGLPLFGIAGTAKKLQPRWLGPFRINKVGKGTRTYSLDLPASYKINPVVDASKLRLFISNDDNLFPRRDLLAPAPTNRDGFLEYDVQAIVAHRYHGRTKALQFLVHWQGFDRSEATWEPPTSLRHSRAIVNAYKRLHRL